MEDQLLAGPFTFSENWLVLRGAVSPQPERFFKMLKHHNMKKIKNTYSAPTNLNYVLSEPLIKCACFRAVDLHWVLIVLGSSGCEKLT